MRKVWDFIIENRFLFLLVLTAILFLGFSFTVKGFSTLYNLTNMTQYAVELGLLGLAETFVIISGGGGIDLSVGSMMSLSAMIIGVLVGKLGWNLFIAVIATLICGIIMGLINGVLVSYVRIPAFLVTIATLFIYRSLALIVAIDPKYGPNPMPISSFKEPFYFIGQYKIFDYIPFQVVAIFIPVLVVTSLLLSKTAFGRKLYGVGINEKAALFSGINPKNIRLFAYSLSGLLSSMAGWIITSRIASARPDVGTEFLLQAITISVLGGVSISGGEGTVLGVLGSVIVLIILYNGLELAGIHQIWQVGALGVILIGSVFLNKILLERRKF
jgi:ribose/xylose/arabinose/galactoside ABC-type transport system permease subunit